MEGTWTCEAATVNGRALPETVTQLLHLTLTKDRYLTTRGAETLFDSVYTIDRSQLPPHINIVGTEGALKGQEAQGIYSLAGNTLRICYTMPGHPRPATFDSPPGSEAYLIIWKKAEPL